MILELLGCPYQPLGAYLKALSVLRLTTQEDKQAKGYWNDRCFVLDSKFDEQGLVEFFLKLYRPTPALAPWNGGSGFYLKDRKVGIDAIRATTEVRFATFREDLEKGVEIVAEVGGRADEDERRTEILIRCRNELSDACVEWLDAAIAISAEEKRAFAPILGTGGNEGRLDYTNNFMENLSRLLIMPDKKLPVRGLLEHALLGTLTAGLQSISVGQYDPGHAGGFNQGEGIEAGSVANPWNAVLTLEGAVGWASGIYRKQGVAYRSFLCSPFTVRPSAVGYGSASEKDEESARAEIWTPLWRNPARFREIRALLREGRAAVEGKPARDGMEFANAAASLGVDRGITAFVRYNLLKRRGDSYIALPTGRFPVHYRSTADLIRGLSPFIERANSAAKGAGGEVPNSWPPLMRATEEAMFQALLHGRESSLVEVAAAFGEMHRWLLQRDREVNWPGRLGEAWIAKCRAVGPESRIAAALAGLWNDEAGNLRRNLTPGEIGFSWVGHDLASRMVATLRRRTLDGAQSEQSPFWSSMQTGAEDVIAFLDGGLDYELIENLTFAFVLAKSPEVKANKAVFKNPGSGFIQCQKWPAYCMLKQFFAAATHPSGASDGEPRFRPDLSIASFLAANRVADAVDTGIRRLRIAGLTPMVKRGWDSDDAMRLGAALLIPVWDVSWLRKCVVDEPELEKQEI
jgi:CRISPR-associated protein Csx17